MVFASLAVQLLSIPAQEQAPVSANAALVARAAAGDSRAFRTIFERHAPSVRRYLRDLLRNESAADEATQETFVRAHRKLDAIRDPERLGPWLFGIARNVSLEQRRKLKRERPLPQNDDESPRDIEAVQPSPEALVLGEEADRVLAGALATLREDRRAALLLRIDHHLGYDEIADQLGWSLQKVKNEIHRGRLQLRAQLSKYMKGNA